MSYQAQKNIFVVVFFVFDELSRVFCLLAPCGFSRPRPGCRDGDGESTHCGGGGPFFRVSTTRGIYSACWKHIRVVFFFLKNNPKTSKHLQRFGVLGRFWAPIIFEKAGGPGCLGSKNSHQKMGQLLMGLVYGKVWLNLEKIDWLIEFLFGQITADSQENGSQPELDLPVQSFAKMEWLKVYIASDLCCDAFRTFLWELRKAHCTEFHSVFVSCRVSPLSEALRRLVAVFRPQSHYKERITVPIRDLHIVALGVFFPPSKIHRTYKPNPGPKHATVLMGELSRLPYVSSWYWWTGSGVGV